MFARVTLMTADLAASERFYAAVLATLGVAPTGEATWQDFTLAEATPEHPPTHRLHIGFAAPSREHVDAFHRAGVEAGYPDDGAPGPRPQYGPDYYGGFLLDPDGNSAEAVHHDTLRTGGIVDHLWIRVADVGASKRFYERLAPQAGYRLKRQMPGRAQFAGESGSFSVVAGTPTANAHLAFRGRPGLVTLDPDDNTVEILP